MILALILFAANCSSNFAEGNGNRYCQINDITYDDSAQSDVCSDNNNDTTTTALGVYFFMAYTTSVFFMSQ